MDIYGENRIIYKDMSNELRNITKQMTGSDSFEFFGLKMSQIPDALIKISTLLQISRPDKIIEFGTGYGGLSVLLHLYSKINHCKCITYDIKCHRKDILDITDIDFRERDLTSAESIQEIKQEISNTEGRTILFCDALKSIELATYSSCLKANDIVLMHNYSYEKDSPKFKEIAKVHNWTAGQEQDMSMIEESLIKNGISPLFHDEFEDVYWFCGIKK